MWTAAIAVFGIAAFAISGRTALGASANAKASSRAVAVPQSHQPAPHLSLAQLPMRFERNDGQTDPQVKFLSRGQGYTLFITPGEAVLAMHSPSKHSRPDALRPSRANSSDPGSRISRAAATRRDDAKKDGAGESAVVRITLRDAASSPQVEGIDRMVAKSNYFIGNDPKKWHTDVPNYAKVELENVYRGIDLIYHGSAQAQLEYDFRLAPGANPNAIRLGFGAGNKLALDAKGDLIVSIGESKLVEHAPAVYQESGGKRRTIAGAWKLRGTHEVGFQVASYDRSRPIVIDPVLLYSTYLGGTGGDLGNGIAVDSSGNAYVTGFTASTDFPTKNAFQSTIKNRFDAFVAKLNPSASGAASLLYSTYLGGSGARGNGIAVDSAGNAYVTGTTASTDFPTLNAFQSTCPSAASGCQAAFVAKLNPSASGAASLLYSTYLGGTGSDEANGIAVDSSGNAYVTGGTHSTDFPTLDAFQSTCPWASSGCLDAFVAKLNPAASGAASLLYSTYLGGSSTDFGQGVAVDSSGNAYVTGGTHSTDFPTLDAFQSTCPLAGGGCEAAFVAKLNPSASGAASLLYSTYLGGTGGDEASGIAVDSSGNAYVTGDTFSTDFPTLHAFRSTCPSEGGLNGCNPVFFSKLNPAASGAASLLYSTYLGGTNGDEASGIAVDSSGNAYVTGHTFSTDFPTLHAFQSTCPNGSTTFGCFTGFVAEFDPSASGAASLLYSTYLGGTGISDFGSSIAVDSSSPANAYVTGTTSSTDFPIVNAFQSTNNDPASGNAFVAELSSATALVDPVPDLLVGGGITQDAKTLALKGRMVSGVGADGVSRVVVRIPAAVAGEQFTVSLLNDQGNPSSSSNEDGGLGQISDISFTRQNVIVTAKSTTPPMAFAVYQAPVDFPRPGNISDPDASSRMVTIEAQPLPTGAPSNLSVAILRPPVVLVHGIWGKPSNWNAFVPLINDPENRFLVGAADYSDLIGSRITTFLPDDADALGLVSGTALTNYVQKFARANSLGFSYNAKSVLNNIFIAIIDLKYGLNPAHIPVAAVRADIVGHSMGGDISRYLPLLGKSFYAPFTFSQGPVHKVITIDTPHLGSPLPFDLLQSENQCLRDVFMLAANMPFAAVTLDSAKHTTPGAACELSQNASGMSLCPALQQIHQPSTPRLPTALITAKMGPDQLDPIDSSSFVEDSAKAFCSGDPLAADFTSALWPTIFGGDSDAIVSLTSQLDGLAGTAFVAAVHSEGTEVLGFGGPNVLEQASGVPQRVIDLLNIPVTDTSTYQALP